MSYGLYILRILLAGPLMQGRHIVMTFQASTSILLSRFLGAHWVVVTKEVTCLTNHFFLLYIYITTNGFCSMLWRDYSLLDIIWMMAVEIEVVSSEGKIMIHTQPESLLCACYNTLRKGNLLSCSFSIVNYIDSLIEFTWPCNFLTSFWWGQRTNVPST